MSQKREPEFKRRIFKLHFEEEGTYKSITAEYGVNKAAASNWCRKFVKECQEQSQNDPSVANEAGLMKENFVYVRTRRTEK